MVTSSMLGFVAAAVVIVGCAFLAGWCVGTKWEMERGERERWKRAQMKGSVEP